MSGWCMYWVSVEYTLGGWNMGVVGWYGSGGPWRLLKVIEDNVYVETLEWGMWVVRLRTWRPGSPLKSRMGYLPWLTSCLLLWLKFWSARGASRYPAFMGNCQTISHMFYSLFYPVGERNEVWIQSIAWGQCKNLEFGRLKLGIKMCDIAPGKWDVSRVTLHKFDVGFLLLSDGCSCFLSLVQWEQNTHLPIFLISWTPC